MCNQYRPNWRHSELSSNNIICNLMPWQSSKTCLSNPFGWDWSPQRPRFSRTCCWQSLMVWDEYLWRQMRQVSNMFMSHLSEASWTSPRYAKVLQFILFGINPNLLTAKFQCLRDGLLIWISLIGQHKWHIAIFFNIRVEADLEHQLLWRLPKPLHAATFSPNTWATVAQIQIWWLWISLQIHQVLASWGGSS